MTAIAVMLAAGCSSSVLDTGGSLASSTAPGNEQPTPTEAPTTQVESDDAWRASLARYEIDFTHDGLPILVTGPAPTAIPAIHPPATPTPAIDLAAAEQAARDHLANGPGEPIGRHEVEYVFLADYERFPPGSAADPNVQTTRTLAWVFLSAPVQLSTSGPIGHDAGGPVAGLQLVSIDATTGALLAVSQGE